MDRPLLTPLRKALDASSPLLSETDLRALLSDRRSPSSPLPWYRIPQQRLRFGVIMTALSILLIGIVFSPFHTFDTPDLRDGHAGSQSQHPQSPVSDSTAQGTSIQVKPQQPVSTGAAWRTKNSKDQAYHGSSVDRTPIHGTSISLGEPSSIRVSETTEAALVLASRSPVLSPTNLVDRLPFQIPTVDFLPDINDGDPDKNQPKKDSVWNYAGVYLNTTYTPRTFSELNARLSAKGFPSIKGALFGGGLSYELARPGPDSAAPIAFPGLLYPATHGYAAGITMEWVIQPEFASSDGKRRAAYSSWTVLGNNNIFLHTTKLTRTLFVLSLGVNFSALTLGEAKSFDDLLSGNNSGTISLSRASAIVRTAVRYDLFLGMQYGFIVGYDFSLSKASWRTRSSLQFDPGISVDSGPNDPIGGLYLAFSITLRAMDSMMPSH